MLRSTIALVTFLAIGLSQINLPDWVTPARLGSGGYPWGSSYSQTRWPDSPDSGETRRYDWQSLRDTVNPDGINAPALLVNGQFPGPMIEANLGDLVQVIVRNNITGLERGTGLY
ncbi:MAG: hypothetical protein GOMPHAMPRED_001907 [Gomphillus americanus]|uniref:Plastocyanin-like domain-containing protein n=1 Tax=Gomphillus americanus TaxID=1940652 RepID=A0A8H3FD70_9LECA|nr:MAG: hypothetical protein GOMPHAMPRED_001907 [Gomphillus americanus]